MSHALFLAAALAIGVSLSLQPPINVVMARSFGSPLLAATVSIAISLVVVMAAWATWGQAAGDLAQARTLPWWVVIGGIVGVVFVAGSIVVAPILGVALFFVCVVAGQLVGATVLDHLGAFGLPLEPVTMRKLLGLALVLAGAALVQSSGS